VSDSQFAILAVVAIVALFVGKDVSVITRFGRLALQAPRKRRTRPALRIKRIARPKKPPPCRNDPGGKAPLAK
jgi:hypothetical protein